MPGPVSQSNPGASDEAPYVPSWCYDAPGPQMCICGHHEGYHNDAGDCLLRRKRCMCLGFEDSAGDNHG